jgi:hypothetical protein
VSLMEKVAQIPGIYGRESHFANRQRRPFPFRTVIPANPRFSGLALIQIAGSSDC